MRAELSNQQKRLALAILQGLGAEQGPALVIESWLGRNARQFSLYGDTLDQLHCAPPSISLFRLPSRNSARFALPQNPVGG